MQQSKTFWATRAKPGTDGGVSHRARQIPQRAPDRAEVRELEGDDAETFELMLELLGGLADTPLGAAALDKKRRRGRREANLDDLARD